MSETHKHVAEVIRLDGTTYCECGFLMFGPRTTIPKPSQPETASDKCPTCGSVLRSMRYEQANDNRPYLSEECGDKWHDEPNAPSAAQGTSAAVMTDAEWAGLSPESRHKLNLLFAKSTETDATVEAERLAECLIAVLASVYSQKKSFAHPGDDVSAKITEIISESFAHIHTKTEPSPLEASDREPFEHWFMDWAFKHSKPQSKRNYTLGESVRAAWAESSRRGQEEMRERAAPGIRAVLANHWLSRVVCHYAVSPDDETWDRAECACSQVNLPTKPTVGEAVGTWIEHVLIVMRALPVISEGEK